MRGTTHGAGFPSGAAARHAIAPPEPARRIPAVRVRCAGRHATARDDDTRHADPDLLHDARHRLADAPKNPVSTAQPTAPRREYMPSKHQVLEQLQRDELLDAYDLAVADRRRRGDASPPEAAPLSSRQGDPAGRDLLSLPIRPDACRRAQERSQPRGRATR